MGDRCLSSHRTQQAVDDKVKKKPMMGSAGNKETLDTSTYGHFQFHGYHSIHDQPTD